MWSAKIVTVPLAGRTWQNVAEDGAVLVAEKPVGRGCQRGYRVTPQGPAPVGIAGVLEEPFTNFRTCLLRELGRGICTKDRHHAREHRDRSCSSRTAAQVGNQGREGKG